MTGITYNNQKYIYKINNDNKSKFMKYDWDIIDKNGYKTLIYIKTTNKKNKIKFFIFFILFVYYIIRLKKCANRTPPPLKFLVLIKL